MELPVAIFRKVLEDDTAWGWIRVTRVLSVSCLLENARVGLLVDQEVANPWVIVWIFGLDSDYFQGFKQPLYLELEVMPGLDVVESFTIDNNSRRQDFLVLREVFLDPRSEKTLEKC